MASPEISPAMQIILEGKADAPKRTRLEIMIDGMRRILNRSRNELKEKTEASKKPLRGQISEEFKEFAKRKPTEQEKRKLFDLAFENQAHRERGKWFSSEDVGVQAKNAFREKAKENYENGKNLQMTKITSEAQQRGYARTHEPGTANKIDIRNYNGVMTLLDIDDEKIRQGNQDEKKRLIGVTEHFAEVSLTTSEASEAGRQAWDYVEEIAKEFPDIEEIQDIKEISQPEGIFADIENDIPDTAKNIVQNIEEKLSRRQMTTEEVQHYQFLIDRALQQQNLQDNQLRALQEVNAVLTNQSQYAEYRPPAESVQGDNQEEYIDQNRERRHEYGRYSSIFIDPTIAKELIDNPKFLVEEKMRQSRQNTIPGAIEEQVTKSDLQQWFKYLKDPAYLEDAEYRYDELLEEFRSNPQGSDKWNEAVEVIGGVEVDGEMQLKSKEEFKDYIRDRVKEIGSMIDNRERLQSVATQIRYDANPENISKSMSVIGMEGLNYLLNEDGGLVNKMFNRYRNLLAIKAQTGVRVTPDTREVIKKQVLEEFSTQAQLYNEKYKASLGKDLNHNLNDIHNDLEHILRLADDAMIITMQDSAVLLQGLAPGQDSRDPLTLYQRGTTSEKIAAAMDPVNWFFERYSMLPVGKRLMLNNSARFVAMAEGRDLYVDDLLKHVKQGTPEYDKLVHRAFGDDKKNIELLLGLDWTGKQRKNVPTKFKDVTPKFLKEGLILAEGKRIMRPAIGGYDLFSSNVKNKVFFDHLYDMYGKESENIALGMQLVRGLADVNGKTNHHDEEHAIEGMIKRDDEDRIKSEGLASIFVRVSEYRPQGSMDFLYRGHNEEAHKKIKEWIENGTFNGVLKNGEKDAYFDIFSYIDRRFLAIEEIITDEGLLSINYHDGPTKLSAAQRAVVDRVAKTIEGENATGDQFLDIMHKMSEFTHDKKICKELTEYPYRSFYEYIPWVDDMRINKMETFEVPERSAEAPGGLIPIDTGKGRLPISRRATEIGRSEGDPLAVTWTDMMGIVSALPEMYQTYTIDQEAQKKLLKSAYEKIKSAGGEIKAAEYLMIMSAGYLRTEETFLAHSLTFMGDLPDSSPARIAIASNGPSLDLNEIHHEIVDLGKISDTNLEYMSEHYFHALERYVGMQISDGTKHKIIEKVKLLNMLPLYAFRGKLIIPLGLLILGGAIAASSISGIGAAGAGGGGGHGGGEHH